MWVKICGITNEEDALLSVALGADAVGFVFAPSPRQVTASTARDIVRRLPPEIMTVGVFRDQDARFLSSTVLEAGLQAVQLHGHETPAMAASINPRPRVLIVAAAAGTPAVERAVDFDADAILLDAVDPGGGAVFDWDLVEGIDRRRRIILAGGLDPDNVATAIGRVRPWGVDVSTGVEASPGRKDPRKLRSFIRRALDADTSAGAGDRPGSARGEEDGRPDDGPFDCEYDT
ncbi:MAG: phosphoribosylanthranilate isomerase [Microthrixaceae bacterium]